MKSNSACGRGDLEITTDKFLEDKEKKSSENLKLCCFFFMLKQNFQVLENKMRLVK